MKRLSEASAVAATKDSLQKGLQKGRISGGDAPGVLRSPTLSPAAAAQTAGAQAVPSGFGGAEAGFAGAEAQSLVSLIADFINLTKPRIMVLLLISTVCPMILASGGYVDLPTLVWALLGGGLISGSASALNCVWDRDIDRVMERTKNRPLAAGRVTPTAAVVFSVAIGLGGLLILALMLNPLAASIALFGHFFYVFVYTMWLKRSTPQNIVIGGAAGAVPPMVGWAAVTGDINLTCVLMFLVIFLWTPPHFWALALNKNEDYRRAGVPMLPVIAGERVTHVQMLCYSLALIPVGMLLVLSDPNLGWFSMICMSLLSIALTYKCYELKQLSPLAEEAKTRKAWDVFGFSLIYLALFFVCQVVDSLLV